jgi:hypothetical protein
MRKSILPALQVGGVVQVAHPAAGADAVLLKAINFALTGSDRIAYVFTNRAACVVSWSHPSAEDGVQAIDTFFLNQIDATRTTVQVLTSTTQFGVEKLARVVLHGETAIRENSFSPPRGIALTGNDVTLDLPTSEYDRLGRAWYYIYSHGCKSTHSSY